MIASFISPTLGGVGAVFKQLRRLFSSRTTRLAGTPTLVIGTHFAGPSAGHVVRDGDAFRLEV